ncbi:MAG: hypothetical protein HFH52_05635, partial [Lachnospiraceae bacterium]|nr:hypothetical protein [Lachnospiraceae bacterium]
LLNIILDPIFIFWFDMGVKGAALATVLSQACRERAEEKYQLPPIKYPRRWLDLIRQKNLTGAETKT